MKTVGYFQFDNEEFSVALVLKDFWDENNGIDGSGMDDTYVPEGFYALQESIYEHSFDSTAEAKQALSKAGFVEMKLFDI